MVRTKGVLYVEAPYYRKAELFLSAGDPSEDVDWDMEDEEPTTWYHDFQGRAVYEMDFYVPDIDEDEGGYVEWYDAGDMRLITNVLGTFVYDSIDERITEIKGESVTYRYFSLGEMFIPRIWRFLADTIPETRLKRVLGRTLKIAIPVSPKEQPTLKLGSLHIRVAVDSYKPKIADILKVLESRDCMKSIIAYYKDHMLKELEDRIESGEVDLRHVR